MERKGSPSARAGAHMRPTVAHWCTTMRQWALTCAALARHWVPVGRTWAPTCASEIPTTEQSVEDRKGANFGSGSQLDHSARREIRLRSLDRACWRVGSQLDHSVRREIRLRSLDRACWIIIIIEHLYSVSGTWGGARRSRRPGIARAARGARRRRGWGGR